MNKRQRPRKSVCKYMWVNSRVLVVTSRNRLTNTHEIGSNYQNFVFEKTHSEAAITFKLEIHRVHLVPAGLLICGRPVPILPTLVMWWYIGCFRSELRPETIDLRDYDATSTLNPESKKKKKRVSDTQEQRTVQLNNFSSYCNQLQIRHHDPKSYEIMM